jgi:hypothetical protein
MSTGVSISTLDSMTRRITFPLFVVFNHRYIDGKTEEHQYRGLRTRTVDGANIVFVFPSPEAAEDAETGGFVATVQTALDLHTLLEEAKFGGATHVVFFPESTASSIGSVLSALRSL